MFRAVENRISIVMADGAFRITMVDQHGRMVAEVTPNALYTRLGRLAEPGELDWIDGVSLGERKAGEEG